MRDELPTGPGDEIGPRYYVAHGAAEIKDAADTVYRLFPTIGGITRAPLQSQKSFLISLARVAIRVIIW